MVEVDVLICAWGSHLICDRGRSVYMCFANEQTSHLTLSSAWQHYRLVLLRAGVIELKLIVPVFSASCSSF